ncbi:MAG: hypothetical protein RMK94_07340 [Armatimonadota bacterium]|nr:hypothetical protein [Armatimonadota bacterium]
MRETKYVPIAGSPDISRWRLPDFHAQGHSTSNGACSGNDDSGLVKMTLLVTEESCEFTS